ncbi:Ammonia transport outward protein 2 [Spathaspora sp. JA1]|nr:Ammonia transport outward protein 2 [Spathaspora sp. JA1]
MSSKENTSDSLHSISSNGGSVISNEFPVAKVQTTGDGNEFVIIGNTKYYRHELMSAFAGSLEPGVHPPNSHQIANPAPLGLMAFGVSTLVMSLYGIHAKGVLVPNVAVSLALFYGGVGQVTSGLWEMVHGNTFAATSLVSFGCFWFSYGAMMTPSFGIMEAYMTQDPTQLENAIGFYLMGWAIFAFLCLTLTFKSAVSFVSLFVFIFMTFFLQSIGAMVNSATCTLAGNYFGIFTGIAGFYNAYVGMANKQNSYFQLSEFPLAMFNKQHK